MNLRSVKIRLGVQNNLDPLKVSSNKSKRFATYAWAVVAYNVAVILWGAFVRASGSGAGCGSHWPLCNGEVMPRGAEAATMIELTHRLTSGVALLLVVGLVVWAFRVFEKGHVVRKGAVFSLVFILTEALIGAGLVLFELVADNESVARAGWLGVHLVNTFLLLAAMTLTAWWASGGRPIHWKGSGALKWLVVASLSGTLILGMSGAVAALGDTLFPAGSLAEGLRQDFSPTAHLLVRLRLLHPLLAFTVGGLVVLTAAAAALSRNDVETRRWAYSVAGLVLVQLLVGLLNVALLAPIWLQMVHLLLADLLWLALVLMSAASLAPSETHVESPGAPTLTATAEA